MGLRDYGWDEEFINALSFKIRLCEPRKGNQKGHVERSVEYIRRKAFAHRDTFTSLEEAQTYLTEIVMKLNSRPHYKKKKTHHELMQDERVARTINADIIPFDASELFEFRVDKYSTISYRQNHYSVPEGHVGEWVKVKAGAEKILIFSEEACIATHKRSWQSHQWIMGIYHYLRTFEKKKGALAQSECLSQAPTKMKKLYKDYYIGNEREFLELLIYLKEHNNLEKMNFEKYDLVRIDELGYISFDKEGAELLFTHLSLRAERASTIVTSNLSFNRWEEVFSIHYRRKVMTNSNSLFVNCNYVSLLFIMQD